MWFNKKQKPAIDLNFPEFSEFLKEFKDYVKESSKFRKAVEEHDNILSYMAGTSIGLSISSINPLEINGVKLDVDYRDEDLHPQTKMVKCLLIQKNGATQTKYTKQKNLTPKEKIYYKDNGFVLVDIK